MTCTQSKCTNPATHRYTWPGNEETYTCEACANRAKGLASVMGFALAVYGLGTAYLEKEVAADLFDLIRGDEQ